MPADADQTVFRHAAFVTPEQHHDALRFEDTDFTGAHAESHTFLECTLRGVRLEEHQTRRGRPDTPSAASGDHRCSLNLSHAD